MKRRTFSITLYDGSRVPCAGWEFDAGDGIMLVVHRSLTRSPDGYSRTWSVSDPISGGSVGNGYRHLKSSAVIEARGIVARMGADNVRAQLDARRPKAEGA